MSATVDTRQFNAMCRQLARLSGADLAEVIDHEAARVLEKTAGLTPAASVAKIKANHAKQPAVTYDLGNGKKTYFLQNRFPDPIWHGIQARRAAALARKVRARGLSKQAIAKLASSAGLVIKTPAFAQKAVARTGKTYDNETTRRARSGGNYGLFVASSMPTLRWIGGQRNLQSAIGGRVGFFKRNIQNGVFRSLKTISMRYPGVTVRA